MKKTTLCIITAVALAISTIFTVAVSKASPTPPETNINQGLATETPLTPTPTFTTKEESVFVITDNTGAATKSFIGSELNASTTKLPIEMHVSYYLDNNEISADDLIGKSGHVKITYSFSATKIYQNKVIPFITVTGLKLDPTNFTNIQIENGKIVRESNESIILAGYTLPGLNYDLGTDFLPDSFFVDADVKNFAIDNTYTFATNEIIADLDTSKLSSADNLINSINELSQALDQIVIGASKLADGLDVALDGTKQLQSGAVALNSGAHELANGASVINSGTHELANGADQLANGLNSVVDVHNQILARLDPLTAAIDSEVAKIQARIAALENEDPELAAWLTNLLTELLDYYGQAKTAVNDYTSGVKALSDGANQLSSGAHELANGTEALSNGANALAAGTNELLAGTNTLTDGLGQLDAGAHTLSSGLITFKQQGIDKLVNFANQDLSNFLNNLRATVSAADSYHYYTNQSANSVKFIFKTPSIKQ